MDLLPHGILTNSQALAAVELFFMLGVIFFALSIVYLLKRIWED